MNTTKKHFRIGSKLVIDIFSKEKGFSKASGKLIAIIERDEEYDDIVFFESGDKIYIGTFDNYLFEDRKKSKPMFSRSPFRVGFFCNVGEQDCVLLAKNLNKIHSKFIISLNGSFEMYICERQFGLVYIFILPNNMVKFSCHFFNEKILPLEKLSLEGYQEAKDDFIAQAYNFGMAAMMMRG